MSDAMEFDLDAIDELRLRRWARRHYVAADQRNLSWHSVVLDEMRRKDKEHLGTASRQSYGALVPLAPHGQELPGTVIPTTAEGISIRIDAARDDHLS